MPTPSPNVGMRGSLSEFSLIEVLQVMQQALLTGAIQLIHPDGRVGVVYLNEGKLGGCAELDTGALTLGDVLRQTGVASAQQIEAAFAQQLADAFGKRIGELLGAMGAISEEQLHTALRTKARWTMRELGRWKEGTYKVVVSAGGQPLLPYGEEPVDMAETGVLMEMLQYADEWEEHLAVFLPQGMQTQLALVSPLPAPPAGNQPLAALLEAVPRQRSVRRIAGALGRPELEVARDLAQLVGQHIVRPVGTADLEGGRTRSGRVRLPEPAERLRVESAVLLDLVARMGREWKRKRTRREQLVGLAEFVNLMMDELATWGAARGATIYPQLLAELLARHRLHFLGNYTFHVAANHLDVEHFGALCDEVLEEAPDRSEAFFEEASLVLQLILSRIFDLMNARVATLGERLDNLEAWEGLLSRFGLPRE